MMIPGEIRHEDNLYAATLEVIGAYAQGKSRKAALANLAAMIEEQAAEHGPLEGFKVEVTDDGEATLYVTSNNPTRLIALLLRRARAEQGMSLADVTEATGAKSRNGWAQYEQGRSEPSISKLQEMLDAVAPELAIAIIPRTARVLPRWDEEADDDAELDALIANPSPATAAGLMAKHAKKRGNGSQKAKAAR